MVLRRTKPWMPGVEGKIKDTAENSGHLLPDKEIAKTHAEEGDRKDKGQEEQEDVAQGTELWHVEPMRDEPEVYQCDGDIEEYEAEGASDSDTMDAVVAEARGYESECPPVFVGIATKDEDADEEGLVDDEHEQGGEEEAGKASCGVIELHVVVGYRLHKV